MVVFDETFLSSPQQFSFSFDSTRLNEHKKKVYYRDLELYRDISKELKCGIVNIDEKYNKKILQKKLKINQKSYHSYKINYLKHAKTEQPNSKILAKLIRSTN